MLVYVLKVTTANMLLIVACFVSIHAEENVNIIWLLLMTMNTKIVKDERKN